MSLQTGSPISFGFTGTDGIAAVGLTGTMLLQSTDYEPGHDEEQIKNAAGDLVTRIFANLNKKATLEVIPTGATATAAVTAQTALLGLMRQTISVSACASQPQLIGLWFCTSVKAAGSNTGASKVTLGLEQHANITANAA